MEIEIGTALKNRRIYTIDLTGSDQETQFQIKHSTTTISLSLKPSKSLSLKRKQPEAELEKLNSVVINIAEEKEPEAKKPRKLTVSEEIKAHRESNKSTKLSNLASLRMALRKMGLTGKNIDFVFDHRALDKEFMTLVEKSPQASSSMVTHAAEFCVEIAAGFYRECPASASEIDKALYMETLGFNITLVELLFVAMDQDYLAKASCPELARDLIAVCARLLFMGINGEIVPNIITKAIHDPQVLIIPPTDEATPVWVAALDELRSLSGPHKMVGARERQRQIAALHCSGGRTSTF